MNFQAAERVADAVLYEGYVLYPYRASSTKNRVRWQFGIVAPRPPDELSGEPWFAQTECVIEPDANPSLAARVRFLRVQPRRSAIAGMAGNDPDEAWLDGAPHFIDLQPMALGRGPVEREYPLAAAGIAARVAVCVEHVNRFLKVRIRLENREPWRPEFAANRDEMLCRALVSAHLLLGIEGGAFVSLLDPPEEAATTVASCRNLHAWPVLAGVRPARDVMLSSPIVLYDYPAIAPESPANLCDGTEIDEILSLRIRTLTDEEKREARATDPRAAAIIDGVDALTSADFARLHGTIRSEDFFNPPGHDAPDTAAVTIAGTAVARGSRVRLRPARRADAMDMFLNGQAATVAGVYRDVDDRTLVAVTVEADPAADLHEAFGRFFYFEPDELDPLIEEE